MSNCENNFIVGEGTVTDTNNGLMWQQETIGPMTWEETLSYCEDLQLSGYDDWRLPSINELHSIVDYSVINPSIDSFDSCWISISLSSSIPLMPYSPA